MLLDAYTLQAPRPTGGDGRVPPPHPRPPHPLPAPGDGWAGVVGSGQWAVGSGQWVLMSCSSPVAASRANALVSRRATP